MINFVYLNYGMRRSLRLELKYSFLTLNRFLKPERHRVVIYADAPEIFANWPVTVISIAGKVDEYSLGGRFGHRIKPIVLLDALRRFGDAGVLLDSDSIVSGGFIAGVAEKMTHGAIMNRLEALDPFPRLAGFEAVLPHAGRYRYDPARSFMYNSGLIGARPDHAPIIEDAIALIDSLMDQPVPRFQIEQLAISEAFRMHQVPIGEIHDTFLHYWRHSLRRYAEWRFAKILTYPWDDMRFPKKELRFDKSLVYLYSRYFSVKKRIVPRRPARR